MSIAMSEATPRKVSSGKGLPTRLEQRLAHADLSDRVTLCEQLRRTLDGHFDPEPHALCPGTKLSFLLHEALEFVRVEDGEPDPAKVEAVFDFLRELPAEESRRLLGGWTRDVFLPTTDAREQLDGWLDIRPLSTLAIEASDGGAEFHSFTDGVAFLNERRPVVQLHIAAGAGKREVLDCLDALQKRIADQWAELVAGRLRTDLLTDAERERGEADREEAHGRL